MKQEKRYKLEYRIGILSKRCCRYPFWAIIDTQTGEVVEEIATNPPKSNCKSKAQKRLAAWNRKEAANA